MKGLDNAFFVSIISIEFAPRPTRRKARAGLSFLGDHHACRAPH